MRLFFYYFRGDEAIWDGSIWPIYDILFEYLNILYTPSVSKKKKRIFRTGCMLAAVNDKFYAANTCINQGNKISNIVIGFNSDIFHEVLVYIWVQVITVKVGPKIDLSKGENPSIQGVGQKLSWKGFEWAFHSQKWTEEVETEQKAEDGPCRARLGFGWTHGSAEPLPRPFDLGLCMDGPDELLNDGWRVEVSFRVP